MEFIGRQHELETLEKLYTDESAQLVVVYGRRRIGKTELIAQFARDKKHIYFTAAQVQPQDNLSQFQQACRQQLDNELLEDLEFRSIEGILKRLAQLADQQRLIVVIDEFQYWAQSDKAIPSLIQRFWDHSGKYSRIMLILCGSYISLMIDYTLAEKSPLYGRRTAQLHVKAFDFRTAAQFFPAFGRKQKIIAYAVLGGVPAYLNQFASSKSIESNIIGKILTKNSFLNEEARFLLRTELRDVRVYFSILRAVAQGSTTLKDICSKLSMSGSEITPYLRTLQELGHLRRHVSLAERSPEKSRKGIYRIEDNFLAFWFRFVEPYESLVEFNRGKELYEQLIAPQLSAYMGNAFEAICRQYVELYGNEAGLPLPQKVGSAWQSDFDIDVVAKNVDGTYTFGECKWSERLQKTLFERLHKRAQETALPTKQAKFICFSLNSRVDLPIHTNDYSIGLPDLLP